jgi:anti-anti-sigma factor
MSRAYPTFFFKVEEHGEKTVFHFAGSLQIENANQIREAFYKTLALEHPTPPLLEIDCAALQHIDASGISLLISFKAALRKKGGHLCLVNLSANLRDLLHHYHLNLYFDLDQGNRELIASSPNESTQSRRPS